MKRMGRLVLHGVSFSLRADARARLLATSKTCEAASRRAVKASLLFLGLFPLLSLYAVAQERTLTVEDGNREIRQEAHRLGVSVDRLRYARRILDEASKLAVSFCDSEPLPDLGRYWIAIHRSRAAVGIMDLMEGLKACASRDSDPGSSTRIRESIITLADRLRIVQPDAVQKMMEDWPPAGVADSSGNSVEQRLAKIRADRLADRLLGPGADVAASLREVEAAGPDLRARSTAILQLIQQMRLSEADTLLDETLPLFESEADSESAGMLQGILVLYSLQRGASARTESLLDLWISRVRAQVGEAEPGLGQQVAGMEFTRSELSIIDTVRLLGSPELTQRALRSFPELDRKLQAVGGLGGFRNALMEEERAGMEELMTSRGGEEERLLAELAAADEMRDFLDWDGDETELEGMADRIEEITDPARQLRLFSSLAVAGFRLYGEMTSALRKRLLQFVARARKQVESDPELESRARPRTIDELESMVYGIWLWSEPEEAGPAIDKLPGATRYRVLLGFLATTAEYHPRYWRSR